MTNKYSGINDINKPAFDAIVPKVKEAMNSGEISGGTKLYLHTITVSGTDKVQVGETMYSDAQIIFITNTSTPITDFGDISSNIISFKMSQYGPVWKANKVNILSMQGMGGTWCDFYCLNNDGSAVTLKILSEATLSDEITDL